MKLRQALAVQLAALLALCPVSSVAHASASNAAASAHGYDVPTTARVDVHGFGVADSSLIGAREGSASRAAEVRGALTTLASRNIATEARMSGATTVGETDLATSNMRKFSMRNPKPGAYDVVGLGSPNDLAGMTPGQLADQIRVPSGGQNVRLLSCQTGCPSGTFAQDLADNLGVRVMAPTTDIGARNTGKTLTIFDGGEWRWFDPN